MATVKAATQAKQQTGKQQTGKAQAKQNTSTKAQQGITFVMPQAGNNGQHTPVTGAMLWQWVNTHAGGQLNNVYVYPLSNVGAQNSAKPTPFGYARPSGTRAMYHNWHLFGYKQQDGTVTQSLGTIANAMRQHDGHSWQQLICTCALLNGGYSRSSPTWGTPFIKLVAYPPQGGNSAS